MSPADNPHDGADRDGSAGSDVQRAWAPGYDLVGCQRKGGAIQTDRLGRRDRRAACDRLGVGCRRSAHALARASLLVEFRPRRGGRANRGNSFAPIAIGRAMASFFPRRLASSSGSKKSQRTSFWRWSSSRTTFFASPSFSISAASRSSRRGTTITRSPGISPKRFTTNARARRGRALLYAETAIAFLALHVVRTLSNVTARGSNSSPRGACAHQFSIALANIWSADWPRMCPSPRSRESRICRLPISPSRSRHRCGWLPTRGFDASASIGRRLCSWIPL